MTEVPTQPGPTLAGAGPAEPAGPAWSLLHRVLLRSAGFPVSWIRELESEPAVGWVTAVLEHDQVLLDRRGPLLGLLADQRRAAADPEPVRAVRRTEQLVRRLRPADPAGLPPAATAALAAWNRVAGERARLLTAATAGWTAELDRLTGRLRARAAHPEFQDAVFTNSPDAAERVRGFAAGARSAKTRRLTLRYLQRFCVKAETAGRYGPINYGTLAPRSPEPVLLHAAGDGRVARRRVLLSYWTAQAIADTWTRSPRLRGLLRLYRAARRDTGSGPPPPSRLMAMATGQYTLAAIADFLGEDLAEVYEQASHAQLGGWLRIGLRVPVTVPDPLAALAGLIGASSLARRERLPERLDRIRAWLTAFEQAGPADRPGLLAAGERLLTAITGAPARRGGGDFYADRFCYTEEGVGNVERLVLGAPVVDRLTAELGPALDLLASAAVGARSAQLDTVAGLLRAADGLLPAEMLLDHPLPPGAGPDLAAVLPAAADRVELDPAELHRAGLVRRDLADWPLFCAPDVMIVADGPAAVRRGDWQLVLAETHHICPPTQLPFATYDPDPAGTTAEVRAAVTDLAGEAVPVLQGLRDRTKARDYTPAGHGVLWLDWQGTEPGTAPVRIGDCHVSADPTGLPRLRGPAGPLALFPEYDEVRPATGLLGALALPQLDKRPVAGPGPSTPRISLGPLIYQRRRWDLGADSGPPTGLPRGSFDEYLATWRWKACWQLPDQVFVRVASEDKPLFVDFRSPLSVDAFLRDVAGCPAMGVEEMLPDLDHLWLEIDGERYCAELRLTAFRGSR